MVQSSTVPRLVTKIPPKGQVSEKTFRLEQDTSELRRYIISPDNKLIKGYDYELTVGQGAFVNLDKLPNEAVEVKFKVPQADDLSLLQLVMEDVDGSLDTDRACVDGLQRNGDDKDFDTTTGEWFAVWNVTLSGRIRPTEEQEET